MVSLPTLGGRGGGGGRGECEKTRGVFPRGDLCSHFVAKGRDWLFSSYPGRVQTGRRATSSCLLVSLPSKSARAQLLYIFDVTIVTAAALCWCRLWAVGKSPHLILTTPGEANVIPISQRRKQSVTKAGCEAAWLLATKALTGTCLATIQGNPKLD